VEDFGRDIQKYLIGYFCENLKLTTMKKLYLSLFILLLSTHFSSPAFAVADYARYPNCPSVAHAAAESKLKRKKNGRLCENLKCRWLKKKTNTRSTPGKQFLGISNGLGALLLLLLALFLALSFSGAVISWLIFFVLLFSLSLAILGLFEDENKTLAIVVVSIFGALTLLFVILLVALYIYLLTVFG
jgi:VIT1/CCC1 family predicted Fe2+/Mn2+ transporter